MGEPARAPAVAGAVGTAAAGIGAVAAYRSLVKPRIASLVAVAVFLGGWLAGPVNWWALAAAVAATALVCAGAGVLNNAVERDVDRRMRRTADRAVASGRIGPGPAAAFGVVLVAAGLLPLLLLSWQAAALAAGAVLLYVAVYTPLKLVAWWNTLVGAVPGAIPPLIGWVVVARQLDLGAWLAFGLLFLWQLPHFYAIAWLCREDYERAGIRMATAAGHPPALVGAQVVGASLLLLAVCVALFSHGVVGMAFLAGGLAVSIAFGWTALGFVRGPSAASARALLRASVWYLPALMLVLAADRVVTGLIAGA